MAATERARTAGFSRHLRLGQLLALVAAPPAVVICAALVVGILTLTHQNAVRDNLLNRVEPANAASLRLLTAMVNQETGIRGYELTGDTVFLQPYTLGRSQARTDIADLHRDALPGTGSALAGAVGAISAWETQIAVPAQRPGAFSDSGGRPSVDTSLASKARFNALRASLATLQDQISKRVRAAKRELASSARNTEIVLAVIGAALIVSVLASGLLLRRFVTRPIEALADSARRVGRGELTHHITLEGPRDIEVLAADVEAMRERLVVELTASQGMQAELTSTAADLQRSNTELEQFAYVASHDLQEPLRKVTSFCQLLESRYGDQLDDRGHQYIAFAVDGSKRMQQLINDLLAFSRVGRTDRTPSRVALGQLVATALTDLTGAIEASGAEIRVTTLPTLAVEPALMRTVFQNLLANAIKFRSEAAPEIQLSAEPDGSDWRFCVSDNGIGIDPEYAERIFVIFQRLHTREAYPGTGIGLAMCRKIVEHHGGRMWLDTEYRDGTRLCFTLPGEDGVRDAVEPETESSLT